MKVRVSGVVLKNDLVLLIRHDYGEEQLWHIPGGGVKELETLTQALQREFLEELGVDVEPDELWLICDSIRPDGVRVLHCVFVVKRLVGKPVIQPQETSGVEYKWIPVTELSSLHLYPHIANQVQQLVDGYPQLLPLGYIGYCQPASRDDENGIPKQKGQDV